MIKELDLKTWHGLVDTDPAATIFHSKNWIQLLADQYRYQIRIFGLFDDQGRDLLAAIPFLQTSSLFGQKKLVSLPFTDEVGLLAFAAKQGDLLDDLYNNFREKFHRIELRCDLPKRHYVVTNDNYVTHKLALSSSSEKIHSTFTKTRVQQPIQQAMRQGVTTEKRLDNDAIDIFFDLHQRVRKGHGMPVQPKSFFRNLKKYLFDQDLGFILIASHNMVPIAASVFLCFNKVITYKYSASDYSSRNLRPNHLILWEAIKWACEHNYQEMDFGISHVDNHGLRKFKSGWGTTESARPYSYLLGNGNIPNAKTGSNETLQKIIQKSPLWVTRLLGELFYRYAG